MRIHLISIIKGEHIIENAYWYKNSNLTVTDDSWECHRLPILVTLSLCALIGWQK